MPVSKELWKTVPILTGQTVMESAEISIPEVKAPTRFLLRLIDSTNVLRGVANFMDYPTQILAEFRAKAADARSIGLVDETDTLMKPLMPMRWRRR